MSRIDLIGNDSEVFSPAEAGIRKRFAQYLRAWRLAGGTSPRELAHSLLEQRHANLKCLFGALYRLVGCWSLEFPNHLILLGRCHTSVAGENQVS